MKEENLFDAITNVNSELVDEAGRASLKRRNPVWKKVTAIAACVALVICAVYAVPHGDNNTNTTDIGNITSIPYFTDIGDITSIPYFADNPYEALQTVNFPEARSITDYDSEIAVMTGNPVEESFLESVNNFSYKTASEIFTGNTENVNYSPLSLYYALSLAATGANGKTAQEMLSLLGVSDKNTLSVQCGNLYRRLYTDNEIGKLKIANSLWISKNLSYKKEFVDNAANNFYAHSFSVDFSDERTSKSMSKWISETTNGVLTPEINVNPEQILSIINTVYFYNEWIDRFDSEKTAEDKFYLSDGSSVSCDFMNRTYASFGFTKGEGFTRSGLIMKNDSQMVFILPDKGVSIGEIVSAPEKLKAAFESGESNNGKVIWQIPKFSFASKLDPEDAVKKLGVRQAFGKGADFTSITEQPAYIDGIIQETHIAIDEKGVEAAAFTEVAYAGAALPQGSAEMILNRPFIYGITSSDGTLLFVGICENPALR